MLFGVPRVTAAYLGGLCAVPVLLWAETHDAWIALIAILAPLLNVLRMAAFKPGSTKPAMPTRPTSTAVYWIGMAFSFDMAALAIRSCWLGDPLAVAFASIAAAGWLAGVLIRASAVPRLAMPQILALFVPMIIAAPMASNRLTAAAAVLLALFCMGCLDLSKFVYERMKAQLLAEHKLSTIARTDYLTGLANRAAFDGRGRDRFAMAAGLTDPIVAMIDLDGFKGGNDSHGHAAGDELLRQVGRRLDEITSGRHFSARLGGDEFAIIFDSPAGLVAARSVGGKS